MVLEDTLLDVIKTVGFPAAITLWFMVRTEKVIERNTQAFIQFLEEKKK